MEFFLSISDGVITNRKQVADAFNKLSDGRYKVKIDSYKKRSLPQNAYLHGCIIPMVYEGLRDAGYDEVQDHEDAKYVIKSLFLKKSIVNKETGEVMEIVKQTSKLTTIEMNQFIEDVVKWGAEYLNIVIPLPSEPLIMFADFDKDLNAVIVTNV